MPTTLAPIEFYKVRVRFITTEEGGRQGPIRPTFASYRPDLTMSGGAFHGAVFMDAPNEIALGEDVEVEIAFWCCKSHHDFEPGDTFYLHEGPRRVAEGTILQKGVKQYTRPDED
jgi:translation elongation factor EF-Tu-like GTPase